MAGWSSTTSTREAIRTNEEVRMTFDPHNVTGKYILIGQSAVPEPDLLKWAFWLEAADLQVALTRVGPYRVSTVFLGFDHSLGFRKELTLFETMAFCGGEPVECERCATWLEAEQMHQRMVEQMKARLVVP